MDFKALFLQLSTLFTRLTKEQKMIVVGAIVGVVAFLIFLVTFTATKSNTDRYEVLFNGISADEASKIVAELEKSQTPYKLEENNIIRVPKGVVYKERMNMAALGIPKNSGVGFELFDNQEFGATSFDQNIKYLRALEGELSRTISSLSPIESASVSLAIPKDSLFVEKSVSTTASVMINIREEMVLSSRQIRGIKNLVASAVTKLSPNEVMLINGNGETLGDEDEMVQMGELSTVQQKYKNKEERKKEKKIIEIISPFVGGSKKVKAQVTIEFDFSMKNSTSESFDPENVVRSEQVSEEKREGATPPEIGGVPGTVSNIGPVKGLKSGRNSQKYEKNTGTTNYEIGKTVSNTKAQFARIVRITAGVIIDGKYIFKKAEDGTDLDELEYKSLDESEMEAISSLVAQSIGVNGERGDTISVKNLKFKQDVILAGTPEMNQVMSFTNTYLAPFSGLFKYIFVMILLFVLYKKVISPFSQRMLEVSKEDDEIDKPILNLEDDQDEDIAEKMQNMRKKVEKQLGVSGDFDEDELKHEVLLDKIKTMVEDSPEEISALFDALLLEESENTINEKGK